MASKKIKRRDFNILLSQQNVINLNSRSIPKKSKYKEMGRKRKHKSFYQDLLNLLKTI
jgi:hypothetical protein